MPGDDATKEEILARIGGLQDGADASNYALGNQRLLTRYVDHGIAEIDNNRDENAIRPLALGRKHCLDIGSDAAGPKVPEIASICATCKRLEIEVLVKFLAWPINPLLTPAARKANHAAV